MSVTSDLITIARADAELMTYLPGGIYAQPLSPDSPVTGTAWQPSLVTQVKRLRPCAVLLEPQEVDDARGLNPERRLDVELWPEFVIYAERADMAAFELADGRAMELWHGQRIGLADIAATGYRARPLEADELPGNVWTIFRRYRVTLSRHIAEV